MSLHLPRTIRLDPSDTFVFPRTAEPGEWAVTGSFLFWDADLAALAPKERAAFRAGFAGVASLGFSTLVVVTAATQADYEDAVEALAGQLVRRMGAPDRDSALAAAREEVAFAASLCEGHAPNTLLAMHRSLENGELREQFRSLRHRDAGAPGADRLHSQAKAFIVVESDADDGEDGPQERIDLLGLAQSKASGERP